MIAKLLIPGDFDDAFAYMGRLICLTCERTVRSFNLESCAEALDEVFASSAPAATYLFARNDWFRSGPFRAILSNSTIRQAFAQNLERFAAEISGAGDIFAAETEFGLDISVESIVDLQLYASRMYLGTSQGLFDLEVDWSDMRPLGPPRHRHDARCLSILPGYGAIHSSCGTEGLFSAFGELVGWSTVDRKHHLQQVAPASMRADWTHYDLVNYASNSEPTLFHTEHGKQRLSDRQTRHVVFGIGRSSDVHTVFDELASHDVARDDVQYIFNSHNSFFINVFDGRFFSLGVKRGPEGAVRITAGKEQAVLGGRVLAATANSLGLVIETDEKVMLLSGGEWKTLHEGPALSVRAFPASKRYRNMVTIVTEDGVWLCSGFDG